MTGRPRPLSRHHDHLVHVTNGLRLITVPGTSIQQPHSFPTTVNGFFFFFFSFSSLFSLFHWTDGGASRQVSRLESPESRVPSPDRAAAQEGRGLRRFVDSSIRARHKGDKGTRVPLRWDTVRTPSQWPAKMFRCPPRPRVHTSPWSTPDFLHGTTNGDCLLPHQCDSDACRSAKLIDRLLVEWARAKHPLLDRHWLLPQTLLVRFVFCTDSPLLSPT